MIELKNLGKTYTKEVGKKSRPALDAVNLLLKEGECLGLLGHNGAGKTTLIRILLGLVHPSQGKMFFDEKPLVRKARQKIGYMPENQQLAARLTCEENLKLHYSLISGRYLSHDLACKALQEVGLLDHRKKKVSDLSKGMGRRLAWAMANISDPQILVLDEPFSGLDPLGRIELHRWLGEKVKAGKGVLLCTHEIKLALSLCDRVQILRLGKECFQQDLRSKPLSDPAELESYFIHEDQAV